MKDKGWIKVYRDIQDHWLWKCKPFGKGQAWLDLLLMANHKPGKVHFGGKLITLDRGQLLTSKLKLAEKWGWNRKTVVGFMLALNRDNNTDTKTDNKSTLITVLNYSQYQDKEEIERDNKEDNNTDLNGTTTGQQNGHKQEVKNERMKEIETGVDCNRTEVIEAGSDESQDHVITGPEQVNSAEYQTETQADRHTAETTARVKENIISVKELAAKLARGKCLKK